MAVMCSCWKCKVEFVTSSSYYGGICDNCSGVNEAKQKEKERWASLSSEQKIEELANKVAALEKKTDWRDARIG